MGLGHKFKKMKHKASHGLSKSVKHTNQLLTKSTKAATHTVIPKSERVQINKGAGAVDRNLGRFDKKMRHSSITIAGHKVNTGAAYRTFDRTGLNPLQTVQATAHVTRGKGSELGYLAGFAPGARQAQRAQGAYREARTQYRQHAGKKGGSPPKHIPVPVSV